MSRSISRLALVAALSITSTSALAITGGWDWDEEIQYRGWTSTSLNWASDIRPDHPSAQWLQANMGPPPRELWCPAQQSPDSTDCDEHHARLLSWATAYLGYTPNLYDLQWPAECPSSCY